MSWLPHIIFSLVLLSASGFWLGACSRSPAPPNRSLQEALDEFQNQWMRSAPSNVVLSFERGIANMRAAGITNASITVGDRAPDFTLSDTQGSPVRLYDLLETGPVILTWHRGGWCPYCTIHLRVLENSLTDIVRFGGRLVAIVPELPTRARQTKLSKELSFTMLSDVGNAVARRYGIVYRVPDEILLPMEQMMDINFVELYGDDSKTLPLAATYIIDTDGIVRFAFLDPDYRNRAEPSDLINALKYIEWN